MALFFLIENLHKDGITIIMITHDMDAVLRYADRVIVFDEGKVVRDEKPVNLFSQDLSKLSIDVPSYFDFALKRDVSDKAIRDIPIMPIIKMGKNLQEILKMIKWYLLNRLQKFALHDRLLLL